MVKKISHVLITGGEGMIGQSLNKYLLLKGFKVSIIDINQKNSVDITNNKIEEVLYKINPDCIVHAAAHPGGKSLEDPVNNTKINSFGSMQIFHWCAKSQIKLIFLSSSAIYGEVKEVPITEKQIPNPGTIYAVNKVACENYLKILDQKYNLDFTILRLFATYGSGHKPNTFQGIVNVIVTQLMKDNSLIIKGSLERKRDLIYVEDTILAIYKSIISDKISKKIINIGTGKSISINDLINELCNVMSISRKKINIVETKGTVGDPFYSVADVSQLKNLLDFEHQFSLSEGLSEMFKYRQI